MKYIILVLLFIQSLSGAQIRPEPDQIVRYKTTEQTPLNLHVFLPDSVQSGDPRPAILFFFGGGWNSGYSNPILPTSEASCRSRYDRMCRRISRKKPRWRPAR